jgi:hypothetical protein
MGFQQSLPRHLIADFTPIDLPYGSIQATFEGGIV